MYAVFGDGGGDLNGNGQNTNTLMGAIVRVEVHGGSLYGITARSPFESNAVCTGASGMWPCPEIYAGACEMPEVLDETGLQIVSVATDVNGELYVLHFGGIIHQIVGAP